MKMTTSRIAELAGVSRGAVDKTIHNRPGVREDVRQKILQVIAETGYVPLSVRKAGTQTKKSYRVAVILPPLTNPYFKALKRYIDEIVFMSNLSTVCFFCGPTDSRRMLSLLKQLREQNFDGYLLRGMRSGSIREELEAINKPIIFFECDIPDVNRLCLVGEDCVKTGRLAASLLAKSVDYHGEVSVITGSVEIPSHQQRLMGFLDVMRTEYPEIRIVRQIYSLDQPAVAYQQTSRVLEDCPHLAGICNLAGCNGEIGHAILESRKKDSVRLVCFSTTSDVITLIQKKIVTFSINLQPREQARMMFETMYAYLTLGKKPSSGFLKTPVTIALDENIDSLLDDFGQAGEDAEQFSDF